uniref:Reverse transcriptase domain-containing protein n=1 Tax=Nothobranchius furzeri TaxID=105023 RepID=A0A8C6MA25_NOTFU
MLSEQLSPFLTEVFKESIALQSLPASMTQGIISLIPKPKKDLLSLDNWRPITLLNIDYKILALLFVNRLKGILPSIIDESQSGFMKNRHIVNNIRLVLDLLDYSDLIDTDSFIMFLDFQKAFDSVEHNFIYKSLEKCGFGPYFCSTIKTLYNNNNSSIKLKFGTSQRFVLSRGIRQGCPISPYLFLIVVQFLFTHISQSPLRGIKIVGKHLVISQLADDTTLFLKDASQVPLALNLISSFSKASGPHLNLNKCELLSIKDSTAASVCDIQVKNQVTYLDIIISKDPTLRCPTNFSSTIQKTQRKLNSWLQRDLSLKGRILLSKAEGLSRLSYTAQSLYVDNNTLKNIDRMLLDFVWKRKVHYIKKSVLINSANHGGLNFIDFSTLNNTLKIIWIRNVLLNPSVWNIIPSFIFSKLGGLKFLLTCNYNIPKIPMKLSNFHKQMLLAWSLIFKHNFSPHTCFIWNNKYITHKKKSVY